MYFIIQRDILDNSRIEYIETKNKTSIVKTLTTDMGLRKEIQIC